MKKKIVKKNQEEQKVKSEEFTLNKNALIAAALNLIFVGLGYLYIKQYSRAALSFMVYVVAYLIIFYVSSYIPSLIWLGLPITLFFGYDAYKRGEKSKTFLFKKGS